MEMKIKRAFVRLKSEFRKDMCFFGFCGALVGLLIFWQAKAREDGWSKSDWANALFADFLAFKAYALFFFIYLFAGCACTILKHPAISPKHIARMKPMLDHADTRFTQITSSLLAFMAGLSALVALVSFINLDASGLKLIGYAAAFCAFISTVYTASHFVARGAKPFDRWQAAAIAFAISFIAFIWLVFFS